MLAEDVPYGDLTTDQLDIGDRPARLRLDARGPMTVCGTEEAARLFELAGARATVIAPTGHTTAGRLLEAEGPAEALHRAWKTAQVLVELYSGITSGAAAIVDPLRRAGHDTPLACTRKHFPGIKPLVVKAVHAGGAALHRLGLSETLLIFHEHRLFLDESPAETVARLRRRQPERNLVVEVSDEGEAQTWAEGGASVIQLERFAPDRVRALKARLAEQGLTPLLAIAGGVDAGNAVAYAEAGAGILVSSAPYYARPKDVKVTFSRERNGPARTP